MTLVDEATDATADNIQFAYDGGSANDYINLWLSDANLAAAGTTTREDFGLNVDGNAGDDEIVTLIGDGSSTDGAGTAENWYLNSVINANLAVNGGAGNDTIRTLGGGDIVITGGAGNDAIYTDNSASAFAAVPTPTIDFATWVFNTDLGFAPVLSNLVSQGPSTTISVVNAQLTVTFRGITSTVDIAESVGSLVNVSITDLSVNQAIKAAINSDPVLSTMLVATDGPARSLVVTSLIDGARVLGDIDVSFGAVALTAAQLLVPGLVAFVPAAAADLEDGYIGANNTFAQDDLGPTDMTGVDSDLTATDNIVTGGTGNDVIVLSTTVGTVAVDASNEIVRYEAGVFGNDTVVNFADATAATPGTDQFDFTLLGGNVANSGQADLTTIIAADDSINVIAGVPASAAALKVILDASAMDDLVASTHVYVGYDAVTNIGSVFTVVDGTADDDTVVTLVGTIDLADTAYADLTIANFL
jgi:hypothetical protein